MFSTTVTISTAVLISSIVHISYGKSVKTVEYLETDSDSQSQPSGCNPIPNSSVAQFIVGYGSLMQTESKNRTYPNTGENIPVEINGFRREWNIKGVSTTVSTTYLGAVSDKNSSFNGVVFQLPPAKNMIEALTSYDKRENFYCRHKVPLKDIRILNQNTSLKFAISKNETGGGLPNLKAQYWIYVNKPEFTDYPTAEYPIVQSYVDVFISGCLELEEKHNLTDFAKACIETTKGWSGKNWVNDRIYPRRPFVYQPKAGKIDTLLSQHVHQQFLNIKIEG